MLLGYSVTVAISHAIKVGIQYSRLYDISVKFMAKFNLNNLDFKNFLDSILTFALNFAVCYTIISS